MTNLKVDQLRAESFRSLSSGLRSEELRTQDNEVHEHGVLYWLNAIIDALAVYGDPKVTEVGKVAWQREYAVDRLSPVFRALGLATPKRWVAAVQGAQIGFLLIQGASITQIADAMGLAGATAPFQILRRLETRQPDPMLPLHTLTAALRDGKLDPWTRYVRPLLPAKGSTAWRESLAPIKRFTERT